MGRSTRAAELGLVAVTIEGGLIAPEQVQKIVAADRTAKTAEGYGCPKGTGLGDEISRYFRIGQHIWKDYDRIDTPTVTQTAQFAQTLLTQCFGFTDLAGPVEHQDGTRRYRLAWEAKDGRVPVVVAAPVVGADAFNKAQPEFGDGEGGRPRRSPVSLLQDWLNATDHALWGIVFAGDRVRLMRDNASLTRPAWIEADLGAMFRDEIFADFTAWWLIAHATRFGTAGAPPSESPLEQWREEGMKQGIQARTDLRRNVEEALFELGQGLVEANPGLVERIRSGALPLQSLFGELLRTVYRLIFLAVAEDRDLLHPRRTPQAARSLYANSYSFTFWRERSRRRVARDGHHDAWEAMKVTLSNLEHGQDLLGLPALGGLFANSETPALNDALIPNRRFLSAIFCLGFIRKDGVTHRINWRDLKTEELGSVYESLLEIRPQLESNGDFTLDSGAKGNDRKTSGSYYTPDSLVETLLDSSLAPVLDKAEANADTPEDKVAAILDLKVIDPACGSGHFLLGAARRMADRVAKLRNEDAGKEETQAALRDVVSRCIHGVDRNPMAVELAKVALWIESVSPGQPLGFLDANIRCGDALLGVFDLAALEEGIPDEAYKPLTGDDKETATGLRKLNKSERDAGLLKLAFDAGKLSGEFRKFHRMTENTPREVAARAVEFDRIRHTPDWLTLRQACDIYVSAFLLPKPKLPSLAKPLVPTTAHLRKTISGGTMLGNDTVEGELAAAIDSAAHAASVFHWPLEFPDVVVGRGGFDVLLGNPPWERIKLQEQEFFAGTAIADAPNAAARTKMIREWSQAEEGSHERAMVDAFELAKRLAEASSVFFTSPKDEDPTKLPAGRRPAPSRRYPWTGRGDVNTYALFAEHFLNLTREGGRAGVIVPTGIATDATTAPFFGHLVSRQRLAGLIDFENSAPLFPGVHRSFKFCLLTIGSGVASADFAFFLTAPAQLEDERRRFTLSPPEIAKINPNTRTAPVFRSRRDAELTATIYNRVPVLIEEGKDSGNPWGLSFMAMFHMSNDSGSFRTAAQLAEEGFQREGTNWVREAREQAGVTARRQLQTDLLATAENDRNDLLSNLQVAASAPGPARAVVAAAHIERYVPLYEAKMFDQFNHRYSDYSSRGDDRGNRVLPELTIQQLNDPDHEVVPFYWVPSNEATSRKPGEKYLIGYGEATTATTTRTMVMTAFPFSGVGHKTILIFCAENARRRAALLANANALILDYVCRTKVSYLTLAQFIAKQLPILPPTANPISPSSSHACWS
ncbi:Eco57I restriction-modification methylase domain-containing protein [Novosphingobium colocasiae]|uniref:site-specific DNA-methyltransferase (adenine-specific) n=1 Tax=Novosphingobium colocasiae TaxID=1256513 RepID=A0A918PJN3_9SPHN|nr:N-6 DNA methylase [Novosphingobium colocasiae]GGZ12628.1 hypothetical protein GCM10011614_29690 [Novosphingobium colocasiae]